MLRLLGSSLAGPLALVLLLASAAHAGPSGGLALRWSGPADCTQPADIESEVSALLPPGFAIDPARAFEVEIETLPAGGYRLQLREASGASSVRVLGSCGEAAEAAAVLIAMALDANARAPENEPAPEPEPSAPEQPAEAPVPAEPALERGAWTLGAAALGDVGSLPDPSVGVMVGASWSLRALRLGWYGRYLPAQSVDAPPSGTSAKIDLYAFALNGAFLWSMGPFACGPAADLEVGYLHGRAHGAPDARGGGTSWAALTAGALAELRVHPRIWLQFGALLGAPLWQSQFALAPGRLLYSADSLVFRWFLGVGFRIGPTG